MIIQRFTRGFLQTIAVLLGLVAGTFVAFLLGDAHFDSVSTSPWVGAVVPFSFGVPKFAITAILSMIIVMLITMVETTGDAYATGEIVGKRIRPADIAAAIRADGLATFLGGVFNSFPVHGLRGERRSGPADPGEVALGRRRRRRNHDHPRSAAEGCGRRGRHPVPVLGGAALALFAAVAVAGIQTLQKVDFNDHRNSIIVGTALGAAGLITAYGAISGAFPHWAQIFFGSGITLGAIVAIGLNLVFFHTGGHGQAVAGRPGHDLVTLDQVNAMNPEEFADTFGDLVQDAPWMLDAAYAERPFADAYALRGAFQDALLSGSPDQQLSLLQSFPDLGSDDAPHLTYARDHNERGVGGLASEEYDGLAELTAAYRERFGFPLVVSAHDVDKYAKVVDGGSARMANSTGAEKAAALIEVSKILNYRFDENVADANPIASAKLKLATELTH